MELQPDQYIRIIPPPPVVLVSTLYGEVKNVAPFGMNMPVSFEPPLYAIGVSPKRDTYHNIMDTGEFVVGVPGPELVRQTDAAATSFPRDVSEFVESGLTPVPSKAVRPFRIGECQANLECRLEWVKEAGDHFIIVGRVLVAWVRNDLVTGKPSRRAIDPVYHVQTGVYARKGEILDWP